MQPESVGSVHEQENGSDDPKSLIEHALEVVMTATMREPSRLLITLFNYHNT